MDEELYLLEEMADVLTRKAEHLRKLSAAAISEAESIEAELDAIKCELELVEYKKRIAQKRKEV